ncbi:ABC transporter permease subunit [Gemmobacter sp. 24YEA27]|uniref:ABC transporter permease subunit n=1 Tax=Gemmobacter sp. 24YEA27 TaxID=3040672 RepID=UPI0024B34722|nr:ABC transporter permease subunit [Gemmobacter sp. 24YEA27]
MTVVDQSYDLAESKLAKRSGWRLRPEIWLPFLLPVLMLVIWEVGSHIGLVSTRILPRPSTVLAKAWTMTLSGELFLHLGVSALRAFAGLAIGGLLGFALGLSNGLSQRSALLTDTTVQMIRNIPILALIPLVIIWFGVGETARLFLVAISVFFPIYINTFHGVRNVDPQLIEMGRAYGMSQRSLFLRVIFPGALPTIFVGLRYALGLMWFVLVVAETLAASAGLGYMAMQAREFMQLDVVVLSILLYALLGKLADMITRALETRALAWNPAYARQ